MNEQPLVSVIIPVYNAESFLGECLDSALNQSLSSIEVICVNDGSKDSSLAILQDYAARDERVKIIDKPNAGYGNTMNRGIGIAKGKYLAFLESDDCIELNAYKRLVEVAEEYNLDIVKGDYYNLEGHGNEQVLEKVSLTTIKERYWKAFRPLEEQWSFYMPMMNCLGLLKRDMIEVNGIKHNESPGAAHQDMGFWFKTLCCAKSMMFIDEPFYKYRQDNAASSMKSDTTTFATRDEYNVMWDFLQQRPDLLKAALPVFFHRKYGSCMFSYGRAELSLKLPFIRAIAEEYRRDLASGAFKFERFSDSQKDELQFIMDDPDGFYLSSLGGASTGIVQALQEEIASMRLTLERKSKEPASESGLEIMWQDLGDPIISVVIPAYNAVEYLGECLDSVLSQDVAGIEVICIDDGSTDGTLALLEEYSARDPRVRFASQKNAGQGAARNVGVGLAKGKYVHFVDADDRLPEGAYSALLERVSASELDMLLFDGSSFYETAELEKQYPSFRTNYARASSHDEMSGADLFVALKSEGAYRVSPCLALFSAAFLRANDICFPEGIIYEDNVFFAKAICLANKAAHINSPYYLRRVREGSTMTAEIAARNVLSYFEVYLEIVHFALNNPGTYATSSAISSELWAIQRQIVRQYKELSDAQRAVVRSLPPVKLALLDNLVARVEESKKREKAENNLRKVKSSTIWKVGRYATYPARVLKRKLKNN